MDDEELTQDVLDQFDLVCTQYGASSKVRRVSESAALSSDIAVSLSKFKLSKTFSLDAKHAGPALNKTISSSIGKTEVDQLKEEIAALRDELYMKVGELSTLKDATSRSEKSRSEVIRRLESQLASEREEAHKTLTALSSQLAFRDADYQLIASELAHTKEIIASQTSFAVDKKSFISRPDVSPASALLAAMVHSPSESFKTPSKTQKKRGARDSVSPGCSHLPTVITPVPLRRAVRFNSESIWHDELSMIPPIESHPTTSGVKVVPIITTQPTETLFEAASLGVENNQTPCKRPCVELPLPPASAEPSSCRPCYRVRVADYLAESDGLGRSAALPNRLATNMSHLAALSAPLSISRLSLKNSEFFGSNEHRDCEQCISGSETEFFRGLNLLTFEEVELGEPGFTRENALSTISRSVQFLLPMIKSRLKEYMEFFSAYCKGFAGRSKLNVSPGTKQHVGEVLSNVSRGRHVDHLAAYNEDPFAGAPASQVVPVPTPVSRLTSLDESFSQYNSLPSMPVLSSEYSDSADRTLLGVRHCINQLCLLVDALSSNLVSAGDTTSKALGEIAGLIGWFLTCVACILAPSTGTENSLKRVLTDPRPLPTNWIQKLVPVIDRVLCLAANVALHLPPSSSQHNNYMWPPPLVAVLIVCDSLQQSSDCFPKPSAHHAFAPAFRLLTNLVKRNHLPLLDHDCIISSVSNVEDGASSAWLKLPSGVCENAAGDGPCADSNLPFRTVDLFAELCSRLALLQISSTCQLDRNSTLENCLRFANPRSYSAGGKHTNFGCPVSILCKIVKADLRRLRVPTACQGNLNTVGSSLETANESITFKNVKRRCSLLSAFASFIACLVGSGQLSVSSKCPCVAEVYLILVGLGLTPTEWLFRLSNHIHYHLSGVGTSDSHLLLVSCLSALGHLTRTLQSLLLAHGDAAFQTFTDRIPAFFCVVSSLSTWCKAQGSSPRLLQSEVPRHLLQTELVEELNDFDGAMAPDLTPPPPAN